nr:MAG TPA: hypothetical protein [Caudoviricetes sp.]
MRKKEEWLMWSPSISALYPYGLIGKKDDASEKRGK